MLSVQRLRDVGRRKHRIISAGGERIASNRLCRFRARALAQALIPRLRAPRQLIWGLVSMAPLLSLLAVLCVARSAPSRILQVLVSRHDPPCNPVVCA